MNTHTNSPETGKRDNINAGPETASLNFLTKTDVARIFKVTTRTVGIWMARGLLPFFKIGRTVRFTAKSLEAYLDAHFRIARRSLPASVSQSEGTDKGGAL